MVSFNEFDVDTPVADALKQTPQQSNFKWAQVLLWVALLTALEIFAELCLNAGSKKNQYELWFYSGVIAYIGVAIIFAYTMRTQPQKIGTINTIWQAANIAVMFGISSVFLKESFKTIQVFGAVFALIGAILMVVGETI